MSVLSFVAICLAMLMIVYVIVRVLRNRSQERGLGGKMLAISGYWDLNGKSRQGYGHENYLNRFKDTTAFNVDYVMYGTDEITSHIQRLRKHKLTHRRNLSYDSLVRKCETEFHCENILDKISKTSLHDPEHCPSAQLLLVWIAKVLVVRDAMQSLPEYTHYGWIDAGYKGQIKDPERPWPSASLDNVQGLYVRRLENACHDQYWKRGLEKCPIACMWFGDKQTISEFVDHCIEIIRDQLSSGGTVCTEQDVFEIARQRIAHKVREIETKDGEYDAIFL